MISLPPNKKAFSLVELSIVLVILGLLVGGILAGQSLIRAAELRAVSTEYQRYAVAIAAFRDKYFAAPGDMTNATAFWGKDNTNCAGDTGTAATPGTCNGNGDGLAVGASSAAGTAEMFQFWKQLALAGLVEGSYTGLSGPGSVIDSIIGTNIPRSKLNNGGWTLYYLGNYSGDAATFRYNYGNIFAFGVANAASITEGSIFKPEELWNIDVKMDDGLPASGRILPRDNNTFGTANACTTATSQTDATGTYKLNNNTVSCSLKAARIF